MKHSLTQEFKKLFNKDAEYAYFSPGRVNLIGEHIDYNGGLVMPCAITFGTYLLVSPNDDGIFRFRSLNFDDKLDIPVQDDYTKTGENWFNYPLGRYRVFFERRAPSCTGSICFFMAIFPSVRACHHPLLSKLLPLLL